MAARVKRDVNHIPDLVAIVEALNRTEIQVGIFGGSGDDNFVLMYANVNEFGATIRPKRAKRLAVPLVAKARGKSPRQFKDLFPLKTQDGALYLVRNKGASQLEFVYWLATEVNIPERAFIRGTFDEKKEDFEKKAAQVLKRVFRRETTLDHFFEWMGDYMVGSVQRYMTDLHSPPNSFATRSAKGSNNPLVDSGRLREAITYKVVRK